MSMGAPPGMEEYQRLMAERAAADKRKRTIYGVVLVVAGKGERNLDIDAYSGLGWERPFLGVAMTVLLLGIT